MRSLVPLSARSVRVRYPRDVVCAPEPTAFHWSPTSRWSTYGLAPLPRTHLSPDRRRETAARHLDERQGERRERRLGAPRDRLEPALPGVGRGLVAEEVLDHDVDAGCAIRAMLGLGDIPRLRPPADAKDPVRRVGLEAELGEPDANAAPEGVTGLLDQAVERRQ